MPRSAAQLVSSKDWRELPEVRARAGDATRTPSGLVVMKDWLVRAAAPAAAPAGEAAAASRVLDFTISTGEPDREADVLDPAGCDAAYWTEQNPVVLWCHQAWQPPIGRGRSLSIEPPAIRASVKFASTPLAESIFQLYTPDADGDVMCRGCSVGLDPLKWAYDEERRGYDILEWELVELSLCPIGMNRSALADAKAKGVELQPILAWAEETLDMGRGSGLWMRRDELEAMRKALAPPSVAVPAAGDPGSSGAHSPGKAGSTPAPAPFVPSLETLAADFVTAVKAAVQAQVTGALGRVD